MTTTEDDYRDRLARAFTVMQDMRARIEELERGHREPIAVVGMGCRFPGGVTGPDSYWQLLCDGIDAVSEVPESRWSIDDLFDEDRDTPGKTYTRWGGFLDGIDEFDPTVFGILPREVPSMDPQHRLFLEVAWEAFEHGGHAPDQLRGSRTGVFLGLTLSEYLILESQSMSAADIGGYHTTSSVPNVGAGRLSYLLGLRGPAMAVDTACSSSLAALHLACQSLRTGDSDMAVAGGVNALIIPDTFISFSKWGMMASDGRCKTFDASADGMVRSEGCGVVVLKRARDAIADGDNVLAIIRGSALNQDGASGGLSVPNGPAQEDVIRSALDDAGIAPHDVGYVEAHGTGTSLGDPIEVEALAKTIGAGRPSDAPLIIGSVKSNLGHLESAAGMAGFIKTILCLQNGEIPANLHFTEPSPRIPWDLAPIEVPTAPTAWPQHLERRIAGVSAFGFSGTNAHVIVEAAPQDKAAEARSAEDQTARTQTVEAKPSGKSPTVLTLSAGTEPALDQTVSNLVDHLSRTDASLSDLCFTANTGRARMRHRLAVVADSVDSLSGQLQRHLETGAEQSVHRNLAAHQAPKPVFLFTGQGAQSVGMGRVLYQREPVFAEALNRCADLLSQHLDIPLLDILYPGDDTDSAADLIDDTTYAQPAIFSLQWALAELWRSWGITPAAVVGHSVGELAAACAAGVFDLEDGLKLVATRGRLMGSLPTGGSMVSISADEAAVERIIGAQGGVLTIAAVNGTGVTISGDATDVAGAVARCNQEGFETNELVVSHAFHSPLMDPILDEFESIAEAVAFRPPTLPVLSGLTGVPAASDEITTAAYWRDHIRQPVRFGDTIDWLATNGHRAFLEIGPHPVLSAIVNGLLADSVAPSDGHLDIAVLPSLRRNHDDRSRILASLAALHVRGVEVDWAGFHEHRPGRATPLPTYPFQRQRFWFQSSGPDRPRRTVGEPSRDHPMLGRQHRSPIHDNIVFEGSVDRELVEFLDDHEIGGRILLPGAALLEMAMHACRSVAASADVDPDGLTVSDMAFERPLDVTDAPVEIQLVISNTDAKTDDKSDSEVRDLRIFGFDDSTDAWTLHATGRLSDSDTTDRAGSNEDWSEIQQRCRTEISAAEIYTSLRDRGISFGPTFQLVRRLWQGVGESIAEIEMPDTLDGRYTANYHPAVIDAGFLPLSILLPDDGRIYVPMAVGHAQWFAPLPSRLFSHATVSESDTEAPVGGLVRGDIRLVDERGGPLALFTDVALAPLAAATLNRARVGTHGIDGLVETDWIRAPHGDEGRQAPPRGSWLAVDGDDDPAVADIVNRLRGRGETVRSITGAGKDLSATLQAQLADLPMPLAGVIHGGACDGATWRGPTDVSLGDSGPISSLLTLVQQLSDLRSPASPRLWVVTRGAQAPTEGDPVDIVAGAITGLVRTIDLEHPEWRTTTIDLSPHPQVGERDALWRELTADGDETVVALRNGNRLVARVVPYRPDHGHDDQGADSPLRLTMSSRGTLSDLALQPAPATIVGPHDVRIDVRATGMNFRDVLKALDMYPDTEVVFGEECSGVVVEVGAAVERFQPGDAVFGPAYGSCASHVVVDEHLLVDKPAGVGFETVAALPIAYVTAHHALHHRAVITSDDNILIHSAAGGVGHAAVQLAQAAGATVWATAGSPEKRDHLRRMGVEHIFDSRTLDFADKILRATDGRGVDVVLNSLNGAFVDASVQALSSTGRFLEMGKLDVWDEARFASARPDGQFHEIYPEHLYRDQPDEVRSILQAALDGFSDGSLEPTPIQRFPLADAVEAFRFMRTAGHVGKIVLTQPDRSAGERSLSERIRPDGAYLVTGGFGGLGLHVANWLADAGATQLVLMGRSGPGPEAERTLLGLTERGVKVATVQGDVSNHDDVARAIEAAAGDGSGMHGIFHAAGTNDDGTLQQQDWSRFKTVLAPKLGGAMELHRQSLRGAPELFVLFSSASALLGSPGQGNYATANAALDAFAKWRTSRDLPTLSVNWGPWNQVGMTAALGPADIERLHRSGYGSIDPDRALEILGRMPSTGRAQLGVLPVNEHFMATQPFLSGLEPERAAGPSVTTAAEPTGALADEVLATPAGGRWNLLHSRVVDLIRVVFGLDEHQVIDDRQPLGEAGMDSLAAVELRNALGDTIGKALPTTVTFDHPTVHALVTFLQEFIVGPEATTGAESDDDPDQTDAERAAAEVQAMSEDDAERMLLAELEGDGGP